MRLLAFEFSSCEFAWQYDCHSAGLRGNRRLLLKGEISLRIQNFDYLVYVYELDLIEGLSEVNLAIWISESVFYLIYSFFRKVDIVKF